MNERIKELSREVGAVYDVLLMGRHDGVLFTEYELSLFADLIVKECAKRFEQYWNDAGLQRQYSSTEYLVDRLGSQNC